MALAILGIVASPALAAAPLTISESFGAPSIPLDGSTTLAFVIHNTNPNGGAAVTGIGFTDTLPSGLLVATPSGLDNGCEGTATADAGSANISLSGGTVLAGFICVVSVNVSGISTGFKRNSVTVTSNSGTGNTGFAQINVAGPPTTFTAPCSSTGDAGSLVAAIDAANANAGVDTVRLDPGCTYRLSAVDNYWYGPNGLPPISSDIAIEGNGATIARDPSAPSFRLFFVGADPHSSSTDGYPSPGPGVLTLRDVTLTGGLAKGGDSNGGGGGAGMGGAIFNQGTVVLDHSTVSGNLARGGSAIDASNELDWGGGGIGTGAAGYDGGGFGPGGFGGATGGAGGGSSAGGGSGGAGFRLGENGGAATSSSAGAGGGPRTGLGGSGGGASGAASGDGGGGGGGATSGCCAAGAGGDFGGGGKWGGYGGGGGVGGGGAFGTEGGGGGGFGGGGAVRSFFNLTNGGAGGFGGGGGRGGSGGAAGFGGGTGTVSAGGGGAGMGGAIFNMQGTLTVRDSTVAANTALGGADEASDHGKGIAGAVFNLNGTFTAVGSTFASNAAAYYASQVYNLDYDGFRARVAQATLRDTIVANGVGSIAWPFDLASDKSAYNIAPPSGSAANADVSQFDLVRTMNAQEQGTVTGLPLVSDPRLGPLQANGGPTETMALMPGSPAIAAGDPGCLDFVGAALVTDQRGVPRPQGAACDIGAYEVAPPSASTGGANAITPVGASLAGTVTPNSGDAAVRFDYGTTSAYGSQTAVQHLAGVAAFPVSATLFGLSPHTTYHFRAVATSPDGTAVGADQTFTTAARGAVIRGLKLSPTAFAAAPSGPSALTARLHRRYGTKVTFTLDQPAGVRFTVVQPQPQPGREAGGGRCVKPAPKNRGAARCTRLRALPGGFTRAAAAGANRFRFSGRLAGHRLKPGRYRLVATPRSDGKTGRAVGAAFRIVG